MAEAVDLTENFNCMLDLLNMGPQELGEFFEQWGEKPYRALQVLKWVHQRGLTEFGEMTNLSKSLRQRLQETCYLGFPKVLTHRFAQDGCQKWLLQVAPFDEPLTTDLGIAPTSLNAIEMVFIPEDDRNTLCISSQVGCPLNCAFCATAKQGFSRNLTVAELISQVWLAEHQLRMQRGNLSERVISNVVFMGMGEPLLNLKRVIPVIQMVMDDNLYGLSKRRVTVSTAGVVPAISQLKRQVSVNLAVSLHAATDKLRSELVPINRKYPLSELISACRDYAGPDKQHSKITFEYVMLKDINDRPEQAVALSKLLAHCPAKVNLIPFNSHPNSAFQCASSATIEQFRDILIASGILTVIRKTRGSDIEAACGQLAGQVQKRRHSPTLSLKEPIASS